MNPRGSFQAITAYCGTFVLAGGFVALLASVSAGGIKQIGATPMGDPPRSSYLVGDAGLIGDAALADALQAPATDNAVVANAAVPNGAVPNADVAALSVTTEAAAAPAVADQPKPFVVAALPDSSEIVPLETPPVQVSTAPDPAPEEIKPAVATIMPPDDCLLSDVCVDLYLWAFYERTPKQDTNKVHERRKVTVKRKGKTKIVTRRFTRLVDADFTWKDPHAAQRVGMPMINYVIGGMDKSFKRKLLVMLVAAETEGLLPGITSGFRDDYRQAIASGQKAASSMSYHGGSFRGGYGHGVAADLVSVKGKGRSGRWVHSSILWKWIDERGKDFGIGRPYLNRDPPHVAPIDGREYTAHYRAPKPAKVQVASASKKKVQVADAKPKVVADAKKK